MTKNLIIAMTLIITAVGALIFFGAKDYINTKVEAKVLVTLEAAKEIAAMKGYSLAMAEKDSLVIRDTLYITTTVRDTIFSEAQIAPEIEYLTALNDTIYRANRTFAGFGEFFTAFRTKTETFDMTFKPYIKAVKLMPNSAPYKYIPEPVVESKGKWKTIALWSAGAVFTGLIAKEVIDARK